MAGTIIADTLQGTTTTETVNGVSVTIPNTVDMKYVVNGSAKAWSNLDGTGTSSIIDSFNISGMTDNATGDYTNTISSNLSNGNYAVTISYGNQTGGWAAQANGQLKYASTPAAGSYSLTTGNSISGALNDFDRIHSAIHGDLT